MDSYPVGSFYEVDAPWWEKEEYEEFEKEYDPDEND
jgi:hypothetical protein